MIETRSLTKRYGSKTVVDNISVQIQPGVVTGFLGPNGAGKSTTMRMLLGLERPTSGTALIDGVPYHTLKRPLTTVGALLDAGWVHPKRSARDHLRWVAASNRIDTARVDEILEIVGLREAARRKAGEFSLGMRQRLGLATAMLGDPQYYILDEPVNGLDPEGIHWIRQVMRRLADQGKTVLVSSHLLSEMSQTADNLIVIAQGRLLADTTVEAFVAAQGAGTIRVRARRLDELAAALRHRGAEVTVRDSAQDRCLAVTGLSIEEVADVAGDYGVLELGQARVSLEDAFIEMTRDGVEYAGSVGRK